MSAVLKQTQKKYKISLLVEIVIFIVVLVFFSADNYIVFLSFLFGSLSVFVPYCVFVWLMFFVKQEYENTLKMFYYGELVKFILTICIVVFIFKTFMVNFIVFFIGYFITLLLNNLLPFMVSKYFKI
ncbi:hypothetical protein B0186_06430 [Canicola haemoglobinophilus]|uniref:F0F1 ATP synthase subunit I n=1 Tax=Canicola haemoglobinophilus TaxID=733 RepID=A0A1V4B155_9PAST|nr:ATP synthase subunit I [Canicola haemoglobinophilus]OOS00473.1 hypothetical protein B0186_06430 [Canicola haemoglobinophilus]STO55194.1 F0F1 ATP synthase subunit I [Canicola haemoglobinophilus]STO59513.1 F0F1 ATP synthase subunit I [Canicola haemoglobinophilus]STO69235.1 F0F1 ATP synthase subunit I [Canicola haemoglobinophilus]